MEQDKTKKKLQWQQYIGIAFMVLIGAVCGFVMVGYLDRYGADMSLSRLLLSLVGLFVGMYAAMFFHMIVHEAGHLVFGLLTGYKFSSFRILSFLWQKEDDGLKLKRLKVAGTAGQCLMAPPDLKDGRMPYLLYNLGGSIVNCIVGALFLVVHLLCPEVPFLSPLLFIFAVVGFVVAAMNGIPMRMGTVDNDGYNAFAMSRSREALEAFWVQLRVAELTSRGVRLKEMPAEWFAVPGDGAMKNSMVAIRGVFACNRLMDEEKFAEADALMERLLALDSGIVGLHRGLLICDRLYLELIGENRREVADGMLTKEQRKLMQAMKRFPSVLRCEYALALLMEKDAQKAEKLRAEFDKIAQSYPYPQEIGAERELMQLADEKASEQL